MIEFATLYWQYIIVLIIYLTIAFFVTVKTAERAINTRFEKLVRWFVVYPFVLFDWAMNMTSMTVMCLDLPAHKTEVVTARMKRYKKKYGLWMKLKLLERWRLGVAKFLCKIANRIAKEHC